MLDAVGIGWGLFIIVSYVMIALYQSVNLLLTYILGTTL